MYRLLTAFMLAICSLLPISATHSEAHPPAIAQQKETTVYITKTGEKYHRSDCRYLSKSKIKTTKKEAVKNGYGACKVCRP